MQSDEYMLVADIYDNSEWERRVRKSAIFFFGLSIILVLVSHYVFLKFDFKAYIDAKAAFLNGHIDSWDLIFLHFFIPCIYFGWTTITKVLDKVLGSRFFQLPIAFVIVYYFLRAIASIYLGFVIFPILLVFNLVKLLFAGALSRNRIVQFFS